MKNHYEATYILNIQGKEEGLREALDEIKAIIESFDGEVRNIQKMGRRKFERIAGKIDSGFYATIFMQFEPAKLKDLKQKLSLNDKIFRQFYLKTSAPTGKPAKAEAAA